eukprot:Sdes_comp18201_c0_seq2m7749
MDAFEIVELNITLENNATFRASHTGISMRDYCKNFDSITLCLSKGLGAPMGSVLVGSHKFISVARQFRKAFGGAWRQAGYMAAAGLYGIQHNWRRMEEDHKNAAYLTKKLQELGFIATIPTQTNMATISSENQRISFEEMIEELRKKNIIIAATGDTCRFTTHLHITKECVDYTVETIRQLITSKSSKL